MKFFPFPLDAGRGLLFILFTSLYNFYFSLRRAQAARGPLLSAPAESRQRQAQGSFTPLRIPGPKWGAGRPPLETPKSRCATRIGRTPRRFAAGASVPLGKAASACALATAAAPLPLRLGAHAPLPPRSPLGKACRSLRAPPCPRVQRDRSCAQRMVRARCGFAATPPQISRKLLPRKRLGVPSLPSRELRAKHAPARPPGGIPKGAQPSLASLCLLSAGQKVGARRGLSASKESIRNLEKGKEDKHPQKVSSKNQKVQGAFPKTPPLHFFIPQKIKSK